MLKPFATIDGREVYAEQRRYSNATFTWLYVKQGDDFTQLGDPWQCITPKRSEIIRELAIIDEPQREAFTLQAEPATRPKPTRFESTKTTQRVLLTGLDCLAGQSQLFETDGEV